MLIFDLCTSVLISDQCKHIISTASVAGTDVVCIIGTAVLIFGQCMHKISTASVDGIVVICIISTDIIIFGVSNEHYLWPVDKCFIQYMCMSCEITK